MLRKAELLAKVPFTDSYIWQLEKAGKFPRRRQLGPRRVAWVEAEIDAWLAALPEGGPPATTKSPGRPRTHTRGRERPASKTKHKEDTVPA